MEPFVQSMCSIWRDDSVNGTILPLSSQCEFFASLWFFDQFQMNLETGVYHKLAKKESRRTTLTLAYQSLGVIYGDLSTSPLYVYKSTFAEDISHSKTNEEIFEVLSLLKYIFIVLKADDNGEGGTFPLYSLLCRHARVNALPNRQLADEDLSSYKKDIINHAPSSFGAKVKSTLENRKVLQR